MVLLTGYYHETDASRRAEFLDCLQRNGQVDQFDEVHVFVEDQTDPAKLLTSHPELNSARLRLIAHGRRLTYQALFAYANQHLRGHRVIIANADIFFDHTLARLDGYDLKGKLLCLSRWDVQPDGSAWFFDHPGSQDAWIFQAPLREFPCEFQLGVPGCDNRLAWEAEHAGLAISNPARSLRAYHLHLTAIRRYGERQRLVGPTRSIPAGLLGTPWLWFVVPCMGRLEDVQRTIESLLTQSRSSYVLVDYACPDGAGAWIRRRYPGVTVVTVRERTRFDGAQARNRGAAVVDDDGILCFLDADVSAASGFSEQILSRFDNGSFFVPDRQGPGLSSALVCSRAAFDSAEGFDETFRGWGEECLDLRNALHRCGVREQSFPAALLLHPAHPARAAKNSRTIQERETCRIIHAAYRRAKSAVLDETNGNGVSRAALREIYRAIARRHLGESALVSEAPCASVAFHESMGYTIAQFEAGVSSHNNDPRPLTAIPAPLAGRVFTQVVASSVSPVEIEFLSSGKLFVLVGTDWEGYAPAVRWLREVGFKEGLPLVGTRRGTAFEVWALVGEAGERFVIPTQVMLVADRLVRK